MIRTAGLATLVVACLLTCPTWAKRMPVPPKNPETYTSPSDEYALLVDPSNPKAQGIGTYCLTKNGKEVWTGQKPFTLWDAAVTDNGTVAGYAYTYGIEGVHPDGRYAKDDYGDLVIAIFSPEGQIRLEKRLKRQASRFLHADPDPLAEGLLVDGSNDRYIVRIADPDLNRRRETWITWRLTDGQPIDEFEMGIAHGFLVDAQFIRQTPLILMYWRTFGEGDGHGGRFDLVNLNGKTVWSLALPGDYDLAGDENARMALITQMNTKGAILDTNRPREFDVYFAAKNQCVTFTVKQDDKAGWIVQEVGRKPYAKPSTEPKHAQATQLSAPAFRQLDSVRLEVGTPRTEDYLTEPEAVATNGRDRICVLDRRTKTVHILSPTGSRLALAKPTSQDLRELNGRTRLRVGQSGEVYLGATGIGIYGGIKYLRFSPQGERLESVSLNLDSISEEWHFVPGTQSRWVVGYEKVYLLNGEGEVIREVTRRPDGKWLDHPYEAAVAPDGALAVLDGHRVMRKGKPAISLYTTQGDPVRTIPIPKDMDWFVRVAYNGHCVFLTDNKAVVTIGIDGRTVGRFQLPARSTRDHYFGPFVAAGGRELWFVTTEQPQIVRYEIPVELRGNRNSLDDAATRPVATMPAAPASQTVIQQVNK